MNLTSAPPYVLVLLALGLAGLLRAAYQRLLLSAAKHRSLTGHPRMSRRVAALLPRVEFHGQDFFTADEPTADVVKSRQAAFERLVTLFAQRFAVGASLAAEAESGISDLQFTSRYRVPFQFASYVRTRLRAGEFVRSASGVQLVDVDGNHLYDLTGSYGVNLFGTDFYKQCIARGTERVAELGPVLGALHPLVIDNVKRLQKLSGLDEVSFHMSGTEAVMQAVRLARYHTRRKKIVRFCGAYHGWWGEVQPGIGNPAKAVDTFTLQEMSTTTLRVLRSRSDIACVLVNPLQALHPNAGAPSDSSLLDSSRTALFDRAVYTEWLKSLRALCTERGIVLIFDEVFVGFRLAPGGAQEYFGIRADLVTYGKTLGGGLPVGVLCGRHEFMRRYRTERPADVCFARGTFNSHPYVMACMNEFLQKLESPEVQALYVGLEERWDGLARKLDARLQQAGVPVRVASLGTIWTLTYVQPSRYNWMLQYYLRAAGLALSWIGTGRFIFNFAYTDEDCQQVATRIVAAAEAMQRDGWWSGAPRMSNRKIRRQILREMLQAWRPAWPIGSISSPRSRKSGAL